MDLGRVSLKLRYPYLNLLNCLRHFWGALQGGLPPLLRHVGSKSASGGKPPFPIPSFILLSACILKSRDALVRYFKIHTKNFTAEILMLKGYYSFLLARCNLAPFGKFIPKKFQYNERINASIPT